MDKTNQELMRMILVTLLVALFAFYVVFYNTCSGRLEDVYRQGYIHGLEQARLNKGSNISSIFVNFSVNEPQENQTADHRDID